MPATCRLVKASPVHVGPIATRMRAIDQLECAAFGHTPKQALRLGLSSSLIAITAIGEEGPVAMFGVTPLSMLSGKGCAWFLGREEVFRYARDLIVTGPHLVAWMLETFRTMENVVSTDNDKAIRLLKLWGAKVSDDVETHGGLACHRFRFERGAIQGAVATA